MEPDSDSDETRIVRKQASEYAGETSIHGLKYVGEMERTIFERWVWSYRPFNPLCWLHSDVCILVFVGP